MACTVDLFGARDEAAATGNPYVALVSRPMAMGTPRQAVHRGTGVVVPRAAVPRPGTAWQARNGPRGSREAGLEDNRHISVDLLKEQRKAPMKLAA